MTPSYVKGESTTTQGSVNTAVRDPILLSDRSLEIALRVERNRNQVDFYFSIQKDITPAMRKIVAEWMLEKWELCVISRLGWDLSSVTPLDFVEHLIIRLPKIKENVRDVSMEKVRRHAQAFISLAAKEHTFTTYSSSTIAASSIATSMHGLKWNVRSGHNLNFLLSHLTNITKAPQAQLKECMLHMEDIFNEHSRNMRHFCLDIQQSQSSAIYLQGHFHVQHPEYIQEHGATPFSQMSVVSLPLSGTSDSLKQHKHHSFKSVLPCRIKACSMHKHASTEIDKHTI
ncbi:uncharacterized protein LOC26515035 isoform X6 [Drosophila ananassae]|nr:uncharacterized protein LOC26515035 isoform X6 [Drosophila ananassae]